jgi:hypothetical protein
MPEFPLCVFQIEFSRCYVIHGIKEKNECNVTNKRRKFTYYGMLGCKLEIKIMKVEEQTKDLAISKPNQSKIA